MRGDPWTQAAVKRGVSTPPDRFSSMHLVASTQAGYAKFPSGVGYLDRSKGGKVIWRAEKTFPTLRKKRKVRIRSNAPFEQSEKLHRCRSRATIPKLRSGFPRLHGSMRDPQQPDRGSYPTRPHLERLPAQAPLPAKPSIADKKKCDGHWISAAALHPRFERTCTAQPIFVLARLLDYSEGNAWFPKILSHLNCGD